MVHERPRQKRFPKRVITTPVGHPRARKCNLSSYLVGSSELLVDLITPVENDPNHLVIGAYHYLAFANTSDRKARAAANLRVNAWSFLSMADVMDFTCCSLQEAEDIYSFEKNHRSFGELMSDWNPKNRPTAISQNLSDLVESTCGWNCLVAEAIDKYGYPVLFGALDQVGPPWDESIHGPQLCFRIE